MKEMSSVSETVDHVNGANRGIALGLIKELATYSNTIVFAAARNPAAESLVLCWKKFLLSEANVFQVTGANRGIGLGLVKTLAVRPNVVVFAGARDPTAASLVELAASYPNVHPVKVTLGNEADNAAAIAEIESTVGTLDVVITSAAIYSVNTPAGIAGMPLSKLREQFEVNTVGMVALFQAAQKLLLASPTGAPTFAYISTGSASISRYVGHRMNATAYNTSKLAANYIIRELDAQNPKLIAMAIHPGWVATDMGNVGATAAGLPQAPVSVQDSVDGILSRIDGATKEKSSGKFWNYKATFGGKPWDLEMEEIPW
ncbi:NAD(P)-binding protein [Mycena kentingensis (nom. inval.)]|nr:NAD(P)-binding protein [Mycena kentingensis (nom. inval.)]